MKIFSPQGGTSAAAKSNRCEKSEDGETYEKMFAEGLYDVGAWLSTGVILPEAPLAADGILRE